MPDAYDAVIINTQFVAPLEPTDLSGKTLMIWGGPEETPTSIEYFDTYEEVITKYPLGTHADIYKCATAMNKNGAEEMGVATFDAISDEGISALYDLMESDARVHAFTSITLAGFTLDAETVKLLKPTNQKTLIEWCDENQIVLVLVLTPPSPSNNITVDSMCKLVYNKDADFRTKTLLVSPNVYIVAHNDPEAVDDIAGAVAARMESIDPEITLMWKSVKCDVSRYFSNNDVRKLEGKESQDMVDRPHINVLLNDYGLSESFTTDRYISGYNDENAIIRDISITRSIYYIKRALQDAIINLRRNTIKLSYTNQSLNLIRATISTVLEDNLVTAVNPYGMIASYNVVMPLPEEITAYEKSLNILQNVRIEVVLAGEIHTFRFELVVSLGGNE